MAAGQINSFVFSGGSSKTYLAIQVALDLDRRVRELSGKSLSSLASLSTGSSSGAFLAAAIASGGDLEKLENIFRPEFEPCAQITSREGLSWFVPIEEYLFVKRPRVSLFVDPLFPEGAIRAAKTVFDEKLTFKDCSSRLQIAASTVEADLPAVIREGPIWKAVAASFAFKRLFSPIEIPVEHISCPKRPHKSAPMIKLYDATYSGQNCPAISAATRAKEIQKDEGGKIVTVYFNHCPEMSPGVAWSSHYSTLAWYLGSETQKLEVEKAEVMDQAYTILAADGAAIYDLQVPYPTAGISPFDFSEDTIRMLKRAAEKYIDEQSRQIESTARAIVND